MQPAQPLDRRGLPRAAVFVIALALTLPVVPSSAQTDDEEPAPPQTDEKLIELPAFTVEDSRDVSYVGKQALSTTRTGVELLDLSQSVKVLNLTFLNDMSPSLVVDTLRYVGGGQAGNINFADDRFVMRGFNSPADIGDFVDGFRGRTESNTDTSIIERLEIIKGPSAIFVANGPVGGVINKVMKGPVSYRIGMVKVQTGRFDANRAEIDLGGPITEDKKLLYRLVMATQYDDGYYNHTYAHRFIVAPSVAYVFNEWSRLTFKYQYLNYRFSSYNGLPWDERTGRRVDLPADATFSEDDPLNWRRDLVHRGFLEFTTRFNQYLAMRLGGFVSYDHAGRVESVNGSSIPANFVNGTLIPRNTTAQDVDHNRFQFQGDIVATFDTGPIKHRLLVGGEWSDAPDITASFAGTSSPIDPMNPRFPGTVTVPSSPSNKTRNNNKQIKGFVLETATFWNDRANVSVGGSRVKAKTSSRNELTGVDSPELSLTQDLLQYGAVFKIRPDVSVFYGYNENFAPNFLNGRVLPSQLGNQHEYGIKTELFNGRLVTNLSYFTIKQENVPVLSFPQTTPPSYVLVPGQTSEGVDGDISYQVNKKLDIIGTFTVLDAKARSQANSAAPVIVNPVNNISEHTYGLMVRYKFTDGALKGFSAALGVNHLSRRAVTNNNNSIVYGFLEPATIADLILSYDRGSFRYGLNVDNLLNDDYDVSVRNQSIIVPGAPINVKFSVTYKF